MYRGVVLLCLLVTPAAAETYTPDQCVLIEELLDNCVEPPCDSVVSGSEARRLIELGDKLPRKKLNNLCDRVCAGKLTTLDALYRFCPWRRHKL